MKSKSQTGFTLIEMALALLIMGLVVGGGLNLMSSQMESQKLKETQAILEEAKNALIGFAVANRRFAMPRFSNFGAGELRGRRIKQGLCPNFSTTAFSLPPHWDYHPRMSKATPPMRGASHPIAFDMRYIREQ